MATLILEKDDSFTLGEGTSDLDVVGNASGGSETLIVGAGVNASLSQMAGDEGDQVLLAGAAGDYEVSASGNVATLTNGNTSVDLPSGPNSTTLRFSDTSLNLAVDTNAGSVNLGGQALGASAQAITDAGDGNGHGNAPGGTPIPGTDDGGDDGTGGSSGIEQALDGLESPFDASSDQFAFTDDASVGNTAAPLEINGFAANSSTLTVANAEQVSFGNTDLDGDGSADDIKVELQAGQTVNEIQLNDVVDPSALVFDEASAETALGYDAFAIA